MRTLMPSTVGTLGAGMFLVLAPKTEGEFHSAKVGQQLEIRLLQAPHALALGDLVTIHVQFMGHDLANQIVKMMVKQEGGTVLAKKAPPTNSGE